MAGVASVLPPPRLSGDPQADSAALSQWLNDIAKILASQQETIGSLGGDASEVDPNDLPDPASTNLATAQQTANDAYILASSAASRAQKFRLAASVTISDTATSAAATFATPETDTSYFVVVSPCPTATTGTPAAGSTAPSGITKATGTVTVAVGTAPGAGNSVTFDLIAFRALA